MGKGYEFAYWQWAKRRGLHQADGLLPSDGSLCWRCEDYFKIMQRRFAQRGSDVR